MKLKVNEALCSGCGVCRVACSLENMRKVQPALALLKIKGEFPAPGRYKIAFCTQCGVCADSCPEGAITEHGGEYNIDCDRCTRCLICADSCPEAVIVITAAGFPAKCTGCGKCAALCPREAVLAE